MLATKKCCLLGYPLHYSLSPQIHMHFAWQCGFSLDYMLQAVQAEQLHEAVQQFFATGGTGINITSPHKIAACQLAASLDACARAAKAINTLYVAADGTLRGANTDGLGLSRDFARRAIEIKNRTVLILGAGGAVRGIMHAVLAAQPYKVFILNRTLSKSELLAASFADPRVHVQHDSDKTVLQADIIINALSSAETSFYVDINVKNAICYDLNYTLSSIFLEYSLMNGCTHAFNGLGMLVEQAAAAFNLWFGAQPNVALTCAYMQSLQRAKQAADVL